MKLIWSGKKALITGGSCEIALDLAKLLIKASITPVLTYRNEEGKKTIEKALSDYPERYCSFLLDFSNPDTLANIDINLNDNIDFLVDFAQGNFESLIASANDEKSESFLSESISFRARMLKIITRIMMKHKVMKHKAGRLIFISSTAAKMPNRGQGFYSAVKLAGEALYKNIGLELGSKGITTISIRPGYIKAGRGEKYLLNNENEVLKKIPVRKALTSPDVAETIMFFLSDSARGFNATEIVMDGGLTSGK